VTDDDVERLLKSMLSTSSPLDFIPTSLIKSCSGVSTLVVAWLVNLFFKHSTFPAKFETAQVTPLLKKHGLEVSDPANYCPISTLNTISKIMERLVLVQIVSYVCTSSSFDAVQSAYRRLHSTETALLKITDIFAGFDGQQSTILVPLDQSAFDCVDHITLISRLENTFGITGSALDWFQSYIGCSIDVCALETKLCLKYFLLMLAYLRDHLLDRFFSLYATPLSAVINSFVVRHHQYADDTQIYITASRADVLDKVGLLQDCTAGVHSWLQMNGLQLNSDQI
jgi:hypothetical protein